jgi:hypothetical protein
LKKGVVAGEPDLIVESQLARPVGQRRLYGFGGKGGADGDRAIVERHEIPL